MVSSNGEKLLSRPFMLILGIGSVFAASLHLTLPVFPLFWEYQGYSEDSIGVLLALMPLATILTMPFMGKLVDRRGARPFVGLGLVLYGLPFALYPLAPLLPLTVAWRLVQGIGLACFLPAFYTTLIELSPPRRRGEAMGWFGVVKSVIFAIFPGLGLYLLASFSNQIPFFAASAIIIVGLVQCLFLPPTSVRLGPGAPPPSVRAVLALPAVILAIIILFTLTMAYGTSSFIPLFVSHQGIGGLSGFYAVTALAMLLGSLLGGRLSDYWGRTRVVVPALLLLALALAIFSQSHTIPQLWSGAFLFGLGFGAGQAATNAFVIDRTDAAYRGTAIGVYQSAFDLGLGTGQVVFGLLTVHYSYAAAFSGFSLLTMTTLVLVSLWLPGFTSEDTRSRPAPVLLPSTSDQKRPGM